MQPITFKRKMADKYWLVDGTQIIKADTPLDREAEKRIKKCPKEFVDFICSFKSFTNPEENIWFLSYYDYKSREHEVFPWNEFEIQSLESSDTDSRELIETFWDNHLPFLLSVQGGYSYIAICINEGGNYGKIYQGAEPEYEEVTLVAENITEFLEKFSQALITV